MLFDVLVQNGVIYASDVQCVISHVNDELKATFCESISPDGSTVLVEAYTYDRMINDSRFQQCMDTIRIVLGDLDRMQWCEVTPDELKAAWLRELPANRATRSTRCYVFDMAPFNKRMKRLKPLSVSKPVVQSGVARAN
jgi:hypothetical protein